MPHVTIEYIIMMPVLILQIFLFPIFANSLMNTWVDSRRTLAVQDVAGQLGSAVQQLYFSLNHDSIPAGTITYSPGLPQFIESSYYTGNAILSSSTNPSNPSFLQLTVKLVGTSNSVTTTVILGSNVLWKQSIFMSNSTNACVSAQKFSNGTISLWFGG
ncbi:MAG: hypothetical protein WCD81_06080 [Candidatus Bathyarchaeia archaeon]